MAFWAKKNNNNWVDVQKVWVKKTPTTWVAAKKIWIKKSSIWSQFWPNAGPFPEESPYLQVSSTSYPASGSSFPELTLFNYYWYFNGSLTLKYKWEVSNTPTGPWTALSGYSTYQTYSPGNPTFGNYNTLSFTPALSDYLYGKSYFKFTMQATDASGISTYEAVSDGVTVAAPIWYTNPSFTGTPAPGNTIKWNVGEARIQGSSIPVGYMTTIYKTNDNGVTKQYVYGTSTTPDFRFANNYEYTFALTTQDIGYTYYASTYAIYSDVGSPKTGADASASISDNKSVDGVPGPFSITSATKGKYNGSYRPLTVNWTTSEYAKSYEFQIDSSSDGTTWNSQLAFGPVNIFAPTTSYTFNVSSNAAYLRVRVRSTNSTGLYAYTNTVQAVGQAPTPPTIVSAISSTTYVTLTFTPPTDNGSADNIIYNYSYKESSSSTWGNYTYAADTNNTITIYNLTPNVSYDFRMIAINFDQLSSIASNTFTISTQIAPGPLTDVFAKSFDSGYITTFFTTGTNTSSVNVDYLFFQTQPVIADDVNFDVAVSSLQKYYATNTTQLAYPNESYNIALRSRNSGGLSTDYGNVFFVYPNGSDKPTSTTPTFSNVSGTGFTANFNLSGSVNKAVVDLRTGGSSVSGYPKTLSVSAGANAYTIPETLSDSTQYTFYVTPRYTDTTYTSFTYDGAIKSSSVSTLYQFSMGKTLHVGTNGYIGLTSASSSIPLPSSGIVLSIYGGDFVQAQTAGADGSGLLYYWSNSDTYVVRWNGYQYGFLNNSNYRVTYEAKFYTNQSYCDIKYIHVGANVWSNATPTSTPGIYSNGSLISNGITGPYYLQTGTTYRIYYNGASPTASISFTDVEQTDMVNAGAVTGGNSDDGSTSIYTTTNQYTLPTISFGTATVTGSSISIPLAGTYYSYDYTIRTGSYSGTIVAFGNNQTSSTIAASGLSSGTTYYVTASPKNFWLQYGNNTQNSYSTLNLYTVTFSGNGNTSGSPSVSSVSQTSVGGSVTLATVGTLAKTNYIFGGWNTAADGSGTTYSGGSSYTPSSNITLYAKWNFSVTRTLSFNANGGTGAPASQTGTDTGSGATITISSTAPTRTNYTFAGWNTNSSGTGTNYSSGGSITITADTTLYAKWTAVQYTVTWSANGGTGGGTTTQDAGVAHTAPSPGTRTGYTFTGYYNTPALDFIYGPIASGGSFTPTSSITMYARWSAIVPNISSITVTGNGNSTGTTGPGVTVTYSGTNIGSVAYVLYARDTTTSAWVQKNSGTSNNTTLAFTSSQGTLPDQYYITLTPYYGTGGTGTAGTQRSTINNPKSNASGSVTVNY